MSKPIPERSCIGGGGSHPKPELLRFVKGPDDMVWFDPAHKAPGRGAYVFPERKFLEQAIKRKAFSRHIEAQVPDDLFDQVVRGVETRCLQLLGLAKKGGILVAGLEKSQDALKSNQAKTVLLACDAGDSACDKANHWQKHNICVLSGLTKAQMTEATGIENCAVAAVTEEKHPLIIWLKRLEQMKAE